VAGEGEIMLGTLAPIEVAGRLALAIAMAVLIGVAFEGIYKREQHDNPGGIRTFPLLTTLGAVLFLLDPRTLLAFTVGFIAVAAWLYAHIRLTPSATERPSLMIPATNALAFALAPMALTQPPWLVVAAAVTAVVLLESRDVLHRLVQRLARDEVFTLVKFLLLIGVVLPLAPNHAIVSWTPITPFQIWLALVAVSTLSYASYLLQRYLPISSSVLLPAILGGMYSSTVTTVALARQQRQCGTTRDFSGGIVVATAIMYARIAVVIALFNRPLALTLLPALLALCLLGCAVAAWDFRRNTASASAVPTPLPAANPLQLGTALSFAAMFVVIAAVSNWIRTDFGQRGIFALAAITGTTDIDPFVLSLAQGSVAGMSVQALAGAILIAAASNNALKAVYALTFGGVHTCRRVAVQLIALGLVGLVAAGIYLR
jgi:uncharacterized membrane protein (DUF4010 family)